MNVEYKTSNISKFNRQHEVGQKYISLEDIESVKKTIYITCQEIRKDYDEKDPMKIVNSILELPGLIKNEDLTYIPGLIDFDIPNILFEVLTFDNPNIKLASIICLNAILRFNESESLFDSENFCKNCLSTFLNENNDDLLEKMLMLLDNIFCFNNDRINSFFIENNILDKIINIITKTRNQNIVQIAFNIISISCKSKLEKNIIILIFQIISEFQSEYKLLNYYFMKIFYNLLYSDTFLYDEFINLKFYSFVNVAVTNGLSKTSRYGCKIIQFLNEKHNCYNYFDYNLILELLFIEPKDDEKNEVLCLVSAINCLNSFIGKDEKLTSFLLTKESFKNLLYLSQTRSVLFTVNLLKIFVSLYDNMKNEYSDFELTFTVYDDQNIFYYFSKIIDTDDLDTVKQALELIYLIFQKSVPFNKTEECINCFHSAFSPDIFDVLDNFQDETINQIVLQLKPIILVDAQES